MFAMIKGENCRLVFNTNNIRYIACNLDGCKVSLDNQSNFTLSKEEAETLIKLLSNETIEL